jgi:hypothetical protein
VIKRGEGLVELLKMIRQRALRIDIQRRAKFLDKRIDRNAFAEELAAHIPKIMHGA